MIVTESGLAPAPGNILMEINRAEEGDQQVCYIYTQITQ